MTLGFGWYGTSGPFTGGPAFSFLGNNKEELVTHTFLINNREYVHNEGTLNYYLQSAYKSISMQARVSPVTTTERHVSCCHGHTITCFYHSDRRGLLFTAIERLAEFGVSRVSELYLWTSSFALSFGAGFYKSFVLVLCLCLERLNND